MKLQMRAVNNATQKRLFLDLPEKIYKNDPNWIRPLDKDIEDIFDEEKNKLFITGSCKRWLLENENGEAIGRVAAFVNKKYKQSQPTGGIGFFECIEDEKAAHFILDYCKDWLKEKGMEAMDGPINFGERDRFWGLVVEGYYEPLYCMNYNPPYYKDFFESYGFQVYFYQVCYGLKVEEKFQDKFYKRHKKVLEYKNIEARHLVKKDWKKFAHDFAHVYNSAWVSHGEGKSLDEKQAIKTFKSMRSVMDERINWFVYDNGEPVAFWINLPNLNEYFKHFHGKFGLIQKLRFLWMKKFTSISKFVGIVFGVVPEWQGKGIDAFMIMEGAKHIFKYSDYKYFELQWIGDFNPKMMNIAKSLEADVSRQLATYRYLFDREKPFKRHPKI